MAEKFYKSKESPISKQKKKKNRKKERKDKKSEFCFTYDTNHLKIVHDLSLNLKTFSQLIPVLLLALDVTVACCDFPPKLNIFSVMSRKTLT